MYGADANADGNDREATLKIKSTKLYVPIVTLSTKDNVNFTKQLNEGFKRSVYWNEYKSSFQGTNRLFALVFNNTTENDNEVPPSNTANRVQRDSDRKYFLPWKDITNYSVLIDGGNFHDQPVNDQI